MSYLQNILRLSGRSNMGGILASIYVVRKEDVESIPEPVNGVVYGDIVFKAGKGWANWKVSQASGSSSGNTRQGPEGYSKQNRVPFVVPRFTAALLEMFNRCIDDEFIVLHTDTNGTKRLFGLLHSPVRFSFDHTSGNEFANLNRFSCEFYYDGPENMYEYNGAIASAPAGPAPAVVRFNGVAIASLPPGATLNITSDYSLTEYFIIT